MSDFDPMADRPDPAPAGPGYPPPPKPTLGPDELHKRIRGARIALMVVGLLTLGYVIYQTVMVSDQLDSMGLDFGDLPAEGLLLFGLAYAGALLYIFLSFLAKTRPYGASLAGLIIYVVDNVLGAIIEPSNLHRGIFIKVIIIVVLVKAVIAGREYYKVMREEEIEQAFS